MRVITLARRPCLSSVAANVLQYGTGAININATRIAAPGEVIQTHTRTPEASAKDNRPIYGEYGPMETHQKPGQRLGRWTANVLFQHRAGCQYQGTIKAPATSIHGTSTATRRSGVHADAGGHQKVGRVQPVRGYADADGTETVASWKCVPGCPVADLDNQSGERPPGWFSGEHQRGMGFHGAATKANRTLPSQSLGDRGGASRFYRQFQESDVADIPADLIEYLSTLISPKHLADCKVLVVDNPTEFNWVEHADASAHGIIAMTPSKNSPLSEGEMWRVLKPGGHLLLIAPEDEKTGHTGACAIEDAGFEIRDAILLVQEPGHCHYVAKPPGKERHAGCEHLKFQRKLEEVLKEDEDLDPEDLKAAMAEAEAAVDAVSDSTLSKGNVHPTCKPKGMMARLMADHPKDDGPILDMFMGSGTTGIACVETGHDFIGIEMESEYLEIADTRIRYWDRKTVGEGAVIESEHKPKERPKIEQSLEDFFNL